MAQGKRPTVAVIHTSRLVEQALSRAVQTAGFSGATGSGHADMAVVDGRLDPSSGVGAAKVIVLSAGLGRVDLGRWVHAGAFAIIDSDASLRRLVTTIRQVNQAQQPVIPADRALALSEAFDDHEARVGDSRTAIEQLTGREREVLGRIVAGRRASEIARESFVSVATVRTQIQNILRKLDVSGQIEAVAKVQEAGLELLSA